MRNFKFFLLFLSLICTNVHELLAQEIITEIIHTNGSVNAKHHQSDNLLLDYNLKLSQGEFQFYQNSQTNEHTQSTEGTEETVSLEVNLIYPSGTYTPNFVVVFKEEEESQSEMIGNTNTVTFQVTPGIYDVLVQSLKMSDRKFAFNFKELISVTEDTVVTIDLTEADNLITTKFLDQDGNDLKPGIVDFDTGEITDGTANVYATTYIYYKSKRWTPFILYYLWENSDGVENEVWNYYVSDVSDRYALIHSNLGLGYNGEGYVSKYETLDDGVHSALTLQNNPEEWVTHEQAFQPSILGESQESFYYGFSNWDIYDGYGLSGWVGRLFPDTTHLNENLRFHLNNPEDDNPTDIILNPVLKDYFGTADPWTGDENFHINGNYIMLDENRNIIYGSSTFLSGYYFTGYSYHVNEEGVELLPFHPKFSFQHNPEKPITFGNNVPISITSYDEYFVRTSYIGRYGEGRESDIFNTDVLLKKDGNILFEGIYPDFLWTDPIQTGNIELNFTNSNTLVDQIQGKTETKLSFNAGNPDNIPPTLQMLQFRNEANEIIDRFTDGEEGFVRLAAGDFEYNSEIRSLTYVPGNQVKFLYSSHGENDWTELPLTHYPEELVPLAYGDYYEASLASINTESPDAWFDVKIICTDEAGNKQEQTISPAFQLNSTLVIDEIIDSGFRIYPNPFTEEINVQLPETIKGNYYFRIHDLAGKMIHQTQQSTDAKSFRWNGKSLPKGIYILSIENNGKINATRLIKK